jgi:hypothetical protein
LLLYALFLATGIHHRTANHIHIHIISDGQQTNCATNQNQRHVLVTNMTRLGSGPHPVPGSGEQHMNQIFHARTMASASSGNSSSWLHHFVTLLGLDCHVQTLCPSIAGDLLFQGCSRLPFFVPKIKGQSGCEPPLWAQAQAHHRPSSN